MLKDVHVSDDYSATPGTVIGALYYNLGLSVRELAKERKEDLRHKLNCWISKPLPEELPYRFVILKCDMTYYNHRKVLQLEEAL